MSVLSVSLVLALLGSGSVLANFELLLLHTNDMHARFQQTDRYCGLCEDDSSPACYGGFARLKEKVYSLRQGRSSVFLNAGDTYQGTPYYTFYKWQLAARMVNYLDLDAMCLGNHEFDDGVAGLVPFMRDVRVPIVCSNLNTSQEPSFSSPNFAKSTVLTVNGTRIGVIGYLTPETTSLSNTGKIEILDEITSVRTEAERLKAQGVNIIIALGHSGYDKDQEIARAVEEVDVVVGGHTHTLLWNGTQPDIDIIRGPYPTMVRQPSGKMVPVVQAFYATKYLGYLELTFDDQGNLRSYNGTPILLTGDMPQDSDGLAILSPYETNMTSRIKSVIGYSDVFMDGSSNKCKLGECNIGNLITDAFVDYVTSHYRNPEGWTIAAIGLAQAGSIRGTIDTRHNEYHNGSILMGDVMIVIPWGAEVLVANLTGQTILAALEHAVYRYEETITGHVSEFLQVSGLRVVYDVNRTVGQRVSSVNVLCADCREPEYRPLNVTQTYGVVMTEYIARGGDGFKMFSNLNDPIILDEVDYMLVVRHILARSPVNPSVEGRITVNTESRPSSAPTITASWAILLTVSILYTRILL